MKVLIMAAGRGNRIAHLTDGKPKALLPFMGKTLLEFSLDQFAKMGIEEIVVVVGYRRRMLMEFLREHWQGHLQFITNPLYARTNVIFSFWLAAQRLDDSFFYLHADTVFAPEVLRRLSEAPPAPGVLAIDRHTCGEEEMKVRLVNDTVRLVTKQMPSSEADGEFIGLARFDAKALPPLTRRSEQLIEEGHIDQFFEAAVQRTIDQDGLEIHACDITGLAWNEIDFDEDYLQARRRFASLRDDLSPR